MPQKKTLKSIPASEHDEQCTFVEWLESKKLKFSAIPNGGTRHMGTAVKLKKEGVRPGLPDLLILVNDHLVWIEMKRSDRRPKRGGKGGVSDEQWRWIDALNRCDNCQVFVAYSAKEAIDDIEKMLKS